MRILLLLLLAAFISCNGEEKKAGPGRAERACAYNDRIVALYDGLDSARIELAVSVSQQNAAETNRAIEQFNKQVRLLIDSLNTVPDFEGDSSLRIAARDLFLVFLSDADHIRRAMPVLLTQDAIDTIRYPDSMAGPDSLDPNEELIPVYERTMSRSKADAERVQRFFLAQKEFADEYGFLITRNPR